MIYLIGFLSSLEKKLGLDWGNEDDSDNEEVEKGDICKRRTNKSCVILALIKLNFSKIRETLKSDN